MIHEHVDILPLLHFMQRNRKQQKS